MLAKIILSATSEEQAIAQKARQLLDLMEAEIATAFDTAKELGELFPVADSKQLARRYQSYVTAIKIEAHRNVNASELAPSANNRA
ncbi:MAG: ribosomal protein S17E [Halioglobus sp.]|jgi:TetR/AcrR family transcriptional repressor of nem operon